MNRRSFIKNSSAAFVGMQLPYKHEANIFGHGNKKYKWQNKWGQGLQNLPVKDCHEMVWSNAGELVMLTNETKNNLIFFNKDGKIMRSWGNQFPGGHGLTLHDNNLWITDTDLHQVYRYSIDGKLIKTWDAPIDSGVLSKKEDFIPTETAIHTNGDMYIADGYGSQHIFHYSADGNLKNVFGGRGDGDQHLDNAHGIAIDYRGNTPVLVITDRNRYTFKIFSLDGQYLKKHVLPVANVCRPVIKGDFLYSAVLTSENTGNQNSGFVMILVKDFNVVSNIGGSDPFWKSATIAENRHYQTVQLFKHPHDVCLDNDGNLYVCQWNSGNLYPFKFSPL
jgi:peptidylamidoglycolate lyase